MANIYADQAEIYRKIRASLDTLGAWNSWRVAGDSISLQGEAGMEVRDVAVNLANRQTKRKANQVQKAMVLQSRELNDLEKKELENLGFYKDKENLRVAYVRNPESPALVIPNPLQETDTQIQQMWINLHPQMFYNIKQSGGREIPEQSKITMTWIGPYQAWLQDFDLESDTLIAFESTKLRAKDIILKDKFNSDGTMKPKSFDTRTGKFSTGGKRKLDKINKFVIHETAGATEETGIISAGSKGAGVHYFINQEGVCNQYADHDKALVHAGDANASSIGVEVVSPYIPKHTPGVLGSKYPIRGKTGTAQWGARFQRLPKSIKANDPTAQYRRIWKEVIFSPGWVISPGGQDENRAYGQYVLPSPQIAEGTYILTLKLIEDPELNIPRIFRGFNYKTGEFTMRMIGTGVLESGIIKDTTSLPTQPRSKTVPNTLPVMSAQEPGIMSHQHVGVHKDGSWLCLYVFLRIVIGLDAEKAYRTARDRSALLVGRIDPPRWCGAPGSDTLKRLKAIGSDPDNFSYGGTLKEQKHFHNLNLGPPIEIPEFEPLFHPGPLRRNDAAEKLGRGIVDLSDLWERVKDRELAIMRSRGDYPTTYWGAAGTLLGPSPI